jgi:aminoglycoside phosphotransferase (APT) family kinase protein
MTPGKMHPDKVHTDASLVGRLLAAQFPEWADLPIERVPSAGTDNALYRLGDEMVVRMPRIHWAVGQMEKEHEWLTKLAPSLPLPIPLPLAKGEPGEGYPWGWSVYSWLEGENASLESIADQYQAATDLARFIAALREIDSTGGPPPGPYNALRGEPLANRDTATRQAIKSLDGIIDTRAATDVWESCLEAPAWDGPPAWIHGDLQPGNLLAENGRLSAVIDFGCLAVGDPACDVMAAWTFLSPETRDTFRNSLQVDEATWVRGCGWALSFGLIALPYYQNTNPMLAGIARRSIDEALTDYNGSSPIHL